ncbi:MAG: hypothetical protein K6G11_03135 [Lachnospiraceae bacterium]|nr:hypothetical protein [Lachnospiraceae bacterium]
MPLSLGTRKTLDMLTEVYEAYRKQEALYNKNVSSLKNGIIEIINDRIEAIDCFNVDTIEVAENEYEHCDFVKTALQNGWVVSDINMLGKISDTVFYMDADTKLKAGALYKKTKETKITTAEERKQLINEWIDFLVKNNKDNQFMDVLESLVEAKAKKISYVEYPDDKELNEQYRSTGSFDSNVVVKKHVKLESRNMIMAIANDYQTLSQDEKRSLREKETYQMSEMTDEELEEFVPNESQNEWNIKKSNRRAIKEVLGDDVYDSIDDVHKGDDKSREVKIHHALGNKAIYNNEDVLEIDLSGSGFSETRREYRGYHGRSLGKNDIQYNEHDKRLQYGNLVLKENGKKYDHIRAKVNDYNINGKKVTKTRYTIAGPTPGSFQGLFNLGDYSIENTMGYTKQFASKYLEGIFDKWAVNQENPHPININVTGHSRGAVSSGYGVKEINKWLEKYKNDHPDRAQYVDQVKFNLIMRDPVPGFLTNIHKSYNDLRNVKNLNTTLMCSMLQEHYDWIFPLQNVRGAKKIIISTTGHGMDLSGSDYSQREVVNDGLSHQNGFYDAESGEYYRGSGLAELNDGVYICDEKQNIVRLTSISQLNKIIDAVHEEKSVQYTRVKNIQKMVNNWFLDNELTMSYKSEAERIEMGEKADKAWNKILKYDVKRLRNVQNAIKGLDKLIAEGASAEEINAQNEVLIKECKAYMKKTAFPAKGDSATRLGLVNDVLSYAERERNYQARGLDVDVKLNNNLKREGYIERQLNNDNKRLEGCGDIEKVVNDINLTCREAFNEIGEKVGTNKYVTPLFNEYLSALEQGMRLTKNSSIQKIGRTITTLKNKSREYNEYLDMYNDPGIKDQEKLIEIVDRTLAAGTKQIKILNDKTKFIADKSESLNSLITKYQNKCDSLRRISESGMTEITEEEAVRNQLDELIRVNTEKLNQITNQKNKSLLKKDNTDVLDMKLKYLKAIKADAEINGYRIPKVKVSIASETLDKIAREAAKGIKKDKKEVNKSNKATKKAKPENAKSGKVKPNQVTVENTVKNVGGPSAGGH